MVSEEANLLIVILVNRQKKKGQTWFDATTAYCTCIYSRKN